MPHSPTKRISLPGAGVKVPSFVRGARAFSLCSFRKTHEQHQKYPYSTSKKTAKYAFACFSAEPPSQRASDETHFFNTIRATTRNLLAGFLAQPRPPVWRSYKEGSRRLNTSLVRKVGRELSPRGNGNILASKEVLRCTWLLLLRFYHCTMTELRVRVIHRSAGDLISALKLRFWEKFFFSPEAG